MVKIKTFKKKQYGGNMLFLKTLTGKTIALDNIERNITIRELKEKISKKIDIDPEYIRLVWAGNQLGENDLNNRLNNLELNSDYGYDLGRDKGIHIIINGKKIEEDNELLKAKQRLSFMKSMLTDTQPVTFLEDLQNITSNMNISTIPGVREKEKYQRDYVDYDYDDDGYDFDGYDILGYDHNGYDPMGYDIDGYDRDGYDVNGYDHNGIHVDDEPMNRLDGGYLNIKRGGTKKKGKKTKKKNKMDNEIEVFRNVIVGECYETVESTRSTGPWDNRKYYTTLKPRYVGKYLRSERIMQMGEPSAVYIFYNDITGIEEVLSLSYEATTCFIPVECKSITKRKQMLAFSRALKKETEPTRNLEDMSNIIEMINKHI